MSAEKDQRRHGLVKKGDQRSGGARDRDRILHSSAFRRLAGVTQVVAPEEGHVFHNRLTHSLKVGQVGRRLAEHLKNKYADEVNELGGVDPEVVEAAGFAHDLGHPPFGHVTEKELHRLCRHYDLDAGYEGNAQSFRILTKLAVRSSGYAGLNLSRATLNAVLKYPWQFSSTGDHSKKWGAYPEESSDFLWAREGTEPEQRSLEAEIMNFADDVAYSIHDAEDFYRAGLIPMEQLVTGSTELETVFDKLRKPESSVDWQQVADSALPFAIVSRYSGTAAQRAALREWTSLQIQRYVQAVKVTPNSSSKLEVPENVKNEIQLLKSLTWKYVIESPMLASQQLGHKKIISGLFEVYFDAVKTRPSLLPPRFQAYLNGATSNEIFGTLNEAQRQVRIVADIIANMTDTEAIRMYRRVHGFSPGALSDVAPM